MNVCVTFKKTHKLCVLLFFWRAEKFWCSTTFKALPKIFAVRTAIHNIIIINNNIFSCVHKAKDSENELFFASLCTFWCRRMKWKKKKCEAAAVLYMREREKLLFWMMVRKAFLDLKFWGTFGSFIVRFLRSYRIEIFLFGFSSVF